MDLHIDIRWLLDRQERVLGKNLQVLDYSALVAAVARHRVNTPHLDVDAPNAYRSAAAGECAVRDPHHSGLSVGGGDLDLGADGLPDRSLNWAVR
ncbi:MULTISPECIES: hypothetical protein [unclassified Streptomyces]|uniref:hypothetical protein n=1 Tax=unclassified Streptomyces TaxID=2593676 RepID=UPI002E13692C